MKHHALALRDLVRVNVLMMINGPANPVKFKARARVTAISDHAVEVRLLDDFQPLNGYPLHIPLEDAPFALEKLEPGQ